MKELIKPATEEPMEEIDVEEVEAYVECPSNYKVSCPTNYQMSCPLNYVSDEGSPGGDILF